jgi:hypothetical protein
MDKLTENYANLGTEIKEISSALSQNATVLKETAEAFKKFEASKKTEKDAITLAKSLLKTRYDVAKIDFGIETTKISNAAANKLAEKLAPILQKTLSSKDSKIYQGRATTTADNFVYSGVIQSMRDEQRGVKSNQLFFKNTLDNQKLTQMYKDFANKMGMKIDSFQYKLMSFFKVTEQGIKKTLKQVGADIVEGLEKSKWVGGALHDTFRLIGLLGANWMSQFGRLGKILGGAFYIAMDAFGPTLVKLMLQGIGKVFGYLPGMMAAAVGNLTKIVWNTALGASVSAKGPLSMFAPGKWGMMSNAGKASSVMRLGGAALGALGFGAAAIGSGTESYKSFKQGDKVGGSVFGVGALGFGVAAIAAVVAGITAPVTLIAAAIGGIAATVGLIWKNREAIMEHYKRNQGFYDHVLGALLPITQVISIIGNVISWIKDHWPGHGSSGGGLPGGNNADKGTGLVDSIIDNTKGNYVSYGKMKVSKRDGSILNLHELSQDEASAALQAYEKADPTSFNRVYEWVGGDKASLASHSTDAVKKVDGKVVAALSKKGTSEEIDELRGKLIGMSPEKARELVQTSGKLTGSNTQHAVGGWKSHNNPYALGIDLAGGSSWTAEDYRRNLPILREYYEALGYDVNLESPGQGKSTGWHYDIKPKKNMRPAGAQENFEDYEKAKATQTTNDQMAISDILKNQLSKEEQKEFQEKLQKTSKSPEDLVESEKKVLKEMGYYQSQTLPRSPWVKQVDGQETILKNASGNYMFSADQQMQSIANRGVDY